GTSLAGEEPRARLRSRAGDVRRLPALNDWGPTLATLARDVGVNRGRLGFDLLPHHVHGAMAEALPGVELVDASSIWAEVTAIKHPEEVALLRKALEIAQ